MEIFVSKTMANLKQKKKKKIQQILKDFPLFLCSKIYSKALQISYNVRFIVFICTALRIVCKGSEPVLQKVLLDKKILKTSIISVRYLI